MKLKTIKIVLSGNNFDSDRPGGRSLRIMIILLSQLPLVKVDNRKKWGYNNHNYDLKRRDTPWNPAVAAIYPGEVAT